MQKKLANIQIREIPFSKKLGKISYDYPHKREQHELDFAQILIRFGHDVIFIKPSNIPGTKTPDCEWQCKSWEIKTIINLKITNLKRLLKDAFKQSECVILDISQSKMKIETIAVEVLGYFDSPKNKHGIMKHEILIVDTKSYCLINKEVLK